MAYNYEYPYVDPNMYNDDWLLSEMKRLATEWASYNDNWNKWQQDTNEAFADLKNYVMNYFQNLDVQQEINNKLDAMITDGTIMQLFTSDLVPYVMPEWYGAKGDGVTDDTEAIQKALNNSKKIFFKAGKTYLISNVLFINSNTEINGLGATLKNTMNDSLLRNIHYNSNTEYDINIHISNLNIDCEMIREYDQKNNALYFCGIKNLTLDNIKIISPASDGIYIGSYNTDRHNINVLIRNIIIENYHRQGISIIDGTDIHIDTVFIEADESITLSSTLWGIDLEPNTETEIVDVSIENSTIKTGINCNNDISINNPIVNISSCTISNYVRDTTIDSKKSNLTLNNNILTGKTVLNIYSNSILIAINNKINGSYGGIRLSESSHSEIIGNNIVTNNSTDNNGCIEILSSKFLKISKNIFNSNGSCITSRGASSDFIITDNIFMNSLIYGIYCLNTVRNIITGNNLSNCASINRSITSDGTSTNFIVTNNIVKQGVNGDIILSGTNTIDNNITIP